MAFVSQLLSVIRKSKLRVSACPPALPWSEVVGLAQKVRRVWASLPMYEARTREIMSSVWGLGGLSNNSNIYKCLSRRALYLGTFSLYLSF